MMYAERRDRGTDLQLVFANIRLWDATNTEYVNGLHRNYISLGRIILYCLLTIKRSIINIIIGRSEYLFYYCITAAQVQTFDVMTHKHLVIVGTQKMELDMVKTGFHFKPVMNP